MADIKINLGAPSAPATKPASTPATTVPVMAKPAAGITITSTAPAKVAGITIAAATPAAAPAKTAAGPAAQGLSFQNIFNQTKTEAKGPKMIESIASDKSDAAAKLKPILGNAPALQKTMEQEKEMRLKKKLRSRQMLFVMTFILAAGTTFYFFSELSPSFNLFGPNTTARLTDINKNLRGLQTNINKYRYLASQLDLNRFSYVAEQYLDKTGKIADPSTPVTQIKQLTADVADTESELPVILERLRTNLSQDIVAKTYRTEAEDEKTDDQVLQQFQEDLRTALKSDKSLISKSSSGEENQQDLKLIDNTLKLVGNNKLIGTIRGTSLDKFKQDLADYSAKPDDVTKRNALQELFSNLLASTQSDLATISSVKSSRINWTTVIKQIETVTAETDKNFGKGLFETLGGIVYSGYEFDTHSGKIVLSGLTKTNDASNFTLMSNLIDDLEASPYFEQVDMRSFSKSGTVETGFTANFKVDLSLQKAVASAKDKVISLAPNLKERTAVKRISDPAAAAAPKP